MSNFVQRKIVLGFYHWDLSKDGTVSSEDFTTYSKALAGLLNVEEGSERAQALDSAFASLWQAYGNIADEDGNGTITLEEFTAAFNNLMGSDENRQNTIRLNNILFDAFDLDGSGAISPSEYALFLQPAGVTADQAAQAFAHIDRDGDGQVSRDEFALAHFEYWNSADQQAPGNWFYGRY